MQLTINSFGSSIHRQGELFLIKLKEQKVKIAARKINSILITTGCHFSSDSIKLAIEYNIDIVYLDEYGNPFGRFWNGKMGSTAAIRRAQLEKSETQDGINLILNWTITKLNNQKKFLKLLHSRRDNQEDLFLPAISQIKTNIQNLESLTGNSIEELRKQIMGFEGSAAAAYWKVLGQLPPQNFRFSQRSRYPAKDPVNAMVNYAYGVLYSKVENALIIAGLDPYIGFLHTDNYNKKSLTFDFIEMFRIWAEKSVITLFTGRRCKEDMFKKQSSGAIILTKVAKELLITKFHKFLDKRVNYKIKSSRQKKSRKIRRIHIIQAEAHTLSNRLIEKDNNKIPTIVSIEDFIGKE